MSRIQKLVWFTALYLASLLVFALVTFSIRALLQFGQRLFHT